MSGRCAYFQGHMLAYECLHRDFYVYGSNQISNIRCLFWQVGLTYACRFNPKILDAVVLSVNTLQKDEHTHQNSIGFYFHIKNFTPRAQTIAHAHTPHTFTRGYSHTHAWQTQQQGLFAAPLLSVFFFVIIIRMTGSRKTALCLSHYWASPRWYFCVRLFAFVLEFYVVIGWKIEITVIPPYNDWWLSLCK